jgi:hypothetical protein
VKDDEGICHEIAVAGGYVIDPPVWNDFFPQARNWLAVVEEDAQAPGGVARIWCPRGRGKFRYNVRGLREGDLIEFGADAVMGSGRRVVHRWCGEIVQVNERVLRCRHYESVTEMFATIRDRNERTRECG